MYGHTAGMTTQRTVPGVALLGITAGLAVLGILFHYAFTAEYGDITASGLDGAWSALTDSPGVIALALVAMASVAAVFVSLQRWVRIAAVTVPVLMVLSMLAVTPAALRSKRASQFTAAPQCLHGVEEAANDGIDSGKSEGGPWIAAAEESQRAFDSIEHVGLFGGGAVVGVGGCSQGLVAIDDVDFMQHYRRALPEAGWQVVEDAGSRIRAEKAEMAFEARVCKEGGGVWAGRSTELASGLCAEG